MEPFAMSDALDRPGPKRIASGFASSADDESSPSYGVNWISQSNSIVTRHKFSVGDQAIS